MQELRSPAFAPPLQSITLGAQAAMVKGETQVQTFQCTSTRTESFIREVWKVLPFYKLSKLTKSSTKLICPAFRPVRKLADVCAEIKCSCLSSAVPCEHRHCAISVLICLACTSDHCSFKCAYPLTMLMALFSRGTSDPLTWKRNLSFLPCLR